MEARTLLPLATEMLETSKKRRENMTGGTKKIYAPKRRKPHKQKGDGRRRRGEKSSTVVTLQ